VAVIVCLDQASFSIKDWPGRVERFHSRDVDLEVNKLLARLLGGNDQATIPPPPSAPPKKIHTVKLSRETAGRRGRGVTVVSDLPLNGEQLKELATKLKNACGTGGTAKDGRIEIQGDQREVVARILEGAGFRPVLAGG
jgi:predicted translation initiation factor SUI1